MENMFFHMDLLSSLFIFLVGCGVLAVVLVSAHNRWLSSDAVSRNYPVVAWLRPLSEKVGEFYRRYISFADHEELSFDRATREWVYEVAKDEEDIRGFGTSLSVPHRAVILRNAVFPMDREEAIGPPVLTIGPFCRTSLPAAVFLQHVRAELWVHFRTRGRGVVPRNSPGRLLLEYRRGRAGTPAVER